MAPRFGLTATVPKNLDPFPIRGGEITHVLHNAKNGHVDFLEHRDALAHDAERRFLGRGDNHSSVQWHGLAERELGIARTRRQIHKQKIKLAPVHLENELLDGFHDHRPAPNDRLIAFEKEPDAHQLHAVTGGRDELLLGADGQPLSDAHHQRDARPVNVAVHQAHLRSQSAQGAGEIDRNGGLADATLAAGDGHKPTDARDFVLLRPRVAACGRLTGRLLDLHKHVAHLGQRPERLLGRGFDLLRNLRIDAAGRSSEARCVDEEKENCGAPSKEQNLTGNKSCVFVSVAADREPRQSLFPP